MRIVKIVFALLLPPVTVLLHAGLGLQLLLSVLLTLLGYVPGVVHAFWVLTRAPER